MVELVRSDVSLPRGTVTLLFTDIEGSTRLLQELDRTLGRSGQRLEHAGSIELRRADLVAQAKQELVEDYASQARLAREKLAAALKQRVQGREKRRRRLTSDVGPGIP
jgi:hypothetical protein